MTSAGRVSRSERIAMSVVHIEGGSEDRASSGLFMELLVEKAVTVE